MYRSSYWLPVVWCWFENCTSTCAAEFEARPGFCCLAGVTGLRLQRSNPSLTVWLSAHVRDVHCFTVCGCILFHCVDTHCFTLRACTLFHCVDTHCFTVGVHTVSLCGYTLLQLVTCSGMVLSVSVSQCCLKRSLPEILRRTSSISSLFSNRHCLNTAATTRSMRSQFFQRNRLHVVCPLACGFQAAGALGRLLGEILEMWWRGMLYSQVSVVRGEAIYQPHLRKPSLEQATELGAVNKAAISFLSPH